MSQSNVQKLPVTTINESGLEPLGHAVLLQPYEQAPKSGLIQIPEDVRRSMNMADQRAVVIAIGPTAWNEEAHPRAAPGDRVLVTKYAGYFATGKDGKPYRLVNDNDIFCRVDWE